MRKIHMVDLLSQYNKIKKEIDSEIEKVINSTAYINGPIVKEFATNFADYLNVKHVIPCGNGTDALQTSMMALGLKPGDEVITTTFTFIATAEVIALLNLTPILVDVEPDTFNIDPQKIKDAITDKTKAIVPVHLFGQCADMETILKIAKEHNLFVIEDTCQAVGAEYKFSDGSVKKAGTMGDIGCISFFPSKNLGCYGDGGAIFTNDDKLAEMLKVTVNHGMTIRYHHDYIGVNSRLDSIQAAILNVKLKYLDDYNKSRQAAADKYNKAFKNINNIITPFIADYSSHVFHQYTLKINNGKRDEIQKGLTEAGIPSAIYYPIPLHQQKAYLNDKYTKGMFKVSEELCEKVLSLPMHTELDDEQIDHITSTVIDLCQNS